MAFRRQSWKAKGVRDLIPPTHGNGAASIEAKVVIQVTVMTIAGIVRTGIRVMPGLTAITAAQVGAAGGTTPCFRAVRVCMKP